MSLNKGNMLLLGIILGGALAMAMIYGLTVVYAKGFAEGLVYCR